MDDWNAAGSVGVNCAVIECERFPSTAMSPIATPPCTVAAGPRLCPASVNWTVPSALRGVTFAIGITRPPRAKGSGTRITVRVVVVAVAPGAGMGVGVAVGVDLGVGLGLGVGVVGVAIGVGVGVVAGVGLGVWMGLGVWVGVGIVVGWAHRAKVCSCTELPAGRFWPPACSKALQALGLVVASATSVGGVAESVEGYCPSCGSPAGVEGQRSR